MISDLTLADILREHRRGWPDAEAAVDRGGALRLTYPQLDARSSRLANALAGAGVGQGERVLWLGQNSWRLLELILAAAKLGAIVCPANWRQAPGELRFVIEDCDPKVVVWQEEEVGERVQAARALIGPNGEDDGRLWLRHDEDHAGASEYEAFLAAGAEADPQREVAADLAVLMLYTAAFDGTPNAALLTHRGIIAQALVYAPVRGIDHSFRYLNVGPLFHVATLLETLTTFVKGGTNIFLRRTDAAEICRTIAAEKVTGAFVIGPTLEQMVEANRDGAFDLRSLRALPGSPAWNAMVTVDASPWGVTPYGYGQTETIGYATLSLLGGAGRMGRPSSAVSLRILDDAGNEVPDGDAGEIALRGLTVTPGYWNRPELNAQRRGHGWFRTNDIGRRHPDGSVDFLGPKGRMIKSGAENIYLVEVEACLRQHPAVQDVAAIGVPDRDWGHSVRAVIQLKAGQSAEPAELIEHCRARIASYKKPRSVVFIDQLPRAGYAIDFAKLAETHGQAL